MQHPEWFDTNLIEDAKKLIWDRTIETDRLYPNLAKPWMIDDAISNARRAHKGEQNGYKGWALGLGLLDWEAHTAATRNNVATPLLRRH
jgi:hypothetical protein